MDRAEYKKFLVAEINRTVERLTVSQRVGQLFDNIFLMIREQGKDPFYIEDDGMLQYLQKYEMFGHL